MATKKVSKKKASKKVVKSVDSIDTSNEILARLEKLEKKQATLISGIQFVADEVRPIYGLGALALIFDAIFKKLSK